MKMGPTLEQFVKSGQLGPLVLGMRPDEVHVVLGEPTERSRKTNPLVLKYGPLELTFWGAKARAPHLVRLSLEVDDLHALPQQLRPGDWALTRRRSLDDFLAFLNSVGATPLDVLRGADESVVLMPSGARASFVHDHLSRVAISRRDTDELRLPPLADQREPTLDQIHAMLAEARQCSNVGVLNAAFVLAWAALEAALRRTALNAGLKGKIGTQPSALIRELYASDRLSRNEYEMVERALQQRNAVVHGLKESIVEPEVVRNVVRLSERLLSELQHRSR
jgi:hypothetical protein